MYGLGRRRAANRKVANDMGAEAGPITEDDHQRLARLVLAARRQLEPVAALGEKNRRAGKVRPRDFHLPPGLPNNGYMKLGGEHGIGVLLRIAHVALDARGVASDAEYERFHVLCTELREDFVQMFATYQVLFALMLTITIVLQLAESSTYSSSDFETIEVSAWGPDAAAWIAPANHLAVRRAFYCVECAMLAISTAGSIAGFGYRAW